MVHDMITEPLRDDSGATIGVICAAMDITERKRAESNQLLMAEILRLLNSDTELHPLMAQVLRTIRERTGFDAVGLRMREGGDFPYYEQNGFTEEFLREENSLCAKREDGSVIRDADGRTVLECTCGLILSGRTDPSMSCFTEGGSFWTSKSSDLLTLLPEDDPRTSPRNRCIHSGYESVALIPVRSGPEIIGLLQLNAYARGRLTVESVRFFEGLADNIGLALQRKYAEDALRELTATLESKVASRTAQLQHRTRQLQKLTLELSQAEDRERRRIAVILHEDLQQQIAGARLQLGRLKGRAGDYSQRKAIEGIEETLREAIEKSRSLSHDLSPAVLHINDMAEVFGWLARQMQTKHGLTVHVSMRGNMILASESLAIFLFRAAQEMLFNVVQHSGVEEAQLRVRRTRQFLCLSVSDQGCGFNPTELRETAGIGLLSIRERVEFLGGRMKIKSTEGKESRFRIVVPDTPQVAAALPVDMRITPAMEAQPRPGGPLRVLLAEDHEIVRQGLASLLRETPGIDVVGEASNGQDAVDLAYRLRPDVVTMDVSMPVMSGDEATRRIKEHLPETRIIALSMHQEPETIEKMCQAGADGYVLKTAPPEELFAAIYGRHPEAHDASGPPHSN
jgi:signal transduction histidine kinase/CheY-like chemotaxis protein